jgi:AraC family transcriptional regulator
MTAILENTSIELINFAGVASLPRHIEITHRITSGSVTIGRYLLKPNPGAFIGTTQYVAMVHEGSPFEMEWRLPGSCTYEQKRMEPGDIHIVPCDTLAYTRWETSSRMLFIAIDRTLVSQIVGEVFDQRPIELKLQIGIRDRVIQGMTEAWREELLERGTGGQIQAKALATALVVHLFRIYGEGGVNFRVITGGMNGIRLRRVVEYIEEHLNEDINLCALASIAGFSVHHFHEVFKAEAGTSPHHYLIERRVHRAKELLLGNDMPIAQIATEVGFSGQSHLTLHFRRLAGTTPSRFRLAGKSR